MISRRALCTGIALSPILLSAGTSVRAATAEVQLMQAGLERIVRDTTPGLYLTADWEFDLPDGLVDSLRRGIALYFLYEFRLEKPRWYWMDKTVTSSQLVQRIGYSPLSRQYRFSRGGLTQSFGTLEEVLRVVNAALVVAGDIVEVKGGHLEHLTGALAVRAGENRRMHVGKAVLMEELVQGERRLAAHAERSVEGVGAGAQVGHGAQVVHAHLLFLQRIVAAAGAEHGDFIRIDLKGLLGARGHNNAAGDLKARVQTALGDLGIVSQFVSLENNLDGLIAAAVGQRDKADIFRIAHSLGPAADGDLGAVCRGGLVQRCKFRSLHGNSSPL